MTPAEFISRQDVSRKTLLSDIHEIILETDKAVIPVIGKMMGKEMIIYYIGKSNMMKYALSSVKEYMSLHVLPMYGSPVIYNKYIKELDKAKFQKGCINFKSKEEMPLPVVKALLKDCAPVDLLAIREKYLKDKKAKN